MTSYQGQICNKHPELNGLRKKSGYKCMGCSREYLQRWRKDNKGKIAEESRTRRANNPLLHAEHNRASYSKNKSYYIVKSRLRKLFIVKATPPWADLGAIKEVYDQARSLGMEVDHIIPLRGEGICGLHVENNLQIMTKAENAAKSNKF